MRRRTSSCTGAATAGYAASCCPVNCGVGRLVREFRGRLVEVPAPVVASYGLLSVSARENSVSTTLEALEAEVLKLAPADRSHLLERLIASLDADPEVEEAWEREADRREAELDSGVVAAVPGDEALARLRSRLSR